MGLYVTDAYQAEEALPLDIERPDLDEQTSFASIFLFILIATVLALLLLKFELFTIWKLWFLLSVFFTLLVSFAVFVSEYVAIFLAIAFALWRVFKPNVYVHNFTEIFIYGALAAIFVPLLTVFSVAILLVLISIYDYIAVRKTKHMVTLAKSQGKAKVFAGLLVPYKKSVAILGGGDMGFPLLFAAVAMVQYDLGLLDWRTYLIPFFAGMMLFALFTKGDKKKFYPAMPYLTLGCFLGLGLLLLLL